jgi:enediyne biosynthesis protein E4
MPFIRMPVLTLMFAVIFSGCKKSDPKMFRLVQDAGVQFSNTITEYDTFNILTDEYIFNGGGVGVADFNLDGLPDLFFSGNQVGNQLYLNEGKLKFKDVSSVAGIEAMDSWCTGVSIVDINLDGLPDIYVSTSMYTDKSKRKNLLFVHQGLDEHGFPLFEEQADQ